MAIRVTLGSHTFYAADLRRRRGRLTYNDSLVSRTSPVSLIHALGSVASLLREDGRLVPVLISDITSTTFEFIEEIPPVDDTPFVSALTREIILGESLTVRVGTVLRRTGQPFASLLEGTVPHGENLSVWSIHGNGIFYESASAGKKVFFPHYATTAYFTIVEP